MNANTKEIFYSNGYTGTAKYCPEDSLWVGHVEGTRDLIIFGAETLAEAKKDFEEAVDGYLKVCEKVGITPEQPEFN
jgi:predicted HicB family RNase H-like nuclease